MSTAMREKANGNGLTTISEHEGRHIARSDGDDHLVNDPFLHFLAPLPRGMGGLGRQAFAVREVTYAA